MSIFGSKQISHLLSGADNLRYFPRWVFLVVFAAILYPVYAMEYDSHQTEIDGQVFTLQVPKGYRLKLLTDDLKAPRLFVFDKEKNMLIGSRSGHIYRLPPPYTQVERLMTLADYPHSLAIRGQWLYIAQTSGLFRIRYQARVDDLSAHDLQQVGKIPAGWGHNSRTVKVGPDNRLYVSLGISGNCSNEYLDSSYQIERRRGGVMVLDESVMPAQWKTWASGLRNPVGFDWHPASQFMYASNNGPDHLGYQQPPEVFVELKKNSFHGMPWYYYDGKRIRRDSCIQSQAPRTDVDLPVATFPARNAPMDVHFIDFGELATDYKGDAIVALRGSWGTQPSGLSSGDPATRRPPKLVLVRFNKGQATTEVDDLISGFQNENGQRLARPVGVGIGPDGKLYFTSDSGIHGLYQLSLSR